MASYSNRRLIERFIERGERSIGSKFVSVIGAMKAHHSLNVLAEFIAAGNIDGALAMAEAYAAQFASTVNNVFVGAGQAQIDELGDALGVVVNFDQVNTRAVRFMAENRLELVREFTAGQREATHRALLDGMQRGLNPREMAREFRDSIGLTRKQMSYVNRYRAELEGLSPRALNRKLRDARFDRTILDAIDHNTPLSSAQIERMVGRYRERFVKYRAETIARNESLEAVHRGSHEAIQQAVEDGGIEADKITREWATARDERVRDPSIGASTSHRVMHGQVRKYGEPFVSGAGNELLYPGDRSAPPEDTIQCRCRVLTRAEL